MTLEDEQEFENERNKEINDLIDKVYNMEIPELFGDGKLTEDEKRIRRKKKVTEYMVVDKTKCLKCGHTSTQHWYEWEKGGWVRDEYGMNMYDYDGRYIRHCEDKCRCEKFIGRMKTIKVCENGIIVEGQ